MRKRLQVTLLTLLASVIVALTVPLVFSLANVREQRMLADRVADIKQLAAMSGASISSSEHRAIAANVTRYQDVFGVHTAIFDLRGQLRLTSEPELHWREAGIRAQLDVALSGRTGVRTPSTWLWDSAPLIVTEPLVRDGDVTGAIVTVSPAGELRASMAVATTLIAAGAAVLLTGCGTIATRLTSWILRPIRQLDHATQEIGSGRLTARIDEESGPNELRRLTRSFNHMADKVQNSFDRQEAFVANASHQMRNPLHALVLRIDQLEDALLPGHEGDHEHVRQEAKRLGHILQDLLRLARAEHTQTTDCATDVADVAGERLSMWLPVARAREIRLGSFIAEPALARIEPTALSTALDAALDNALKFTPENGTVDVAVEAAAGHIVISIGDSGTGLYPDELIQATDRFWRSPRHQDIPGSGLGLSIIEEVLRGYGAALNIAQREPVGLVVTFTIPAAQHVHRSR